jgi:hypothetical protein
LAALQGQANIPSTASGTTSLTIARLKAATNQRAKVLGYGFYFDGTSNSAQPVQIRIGRIPTTDITSPSALTITPNEDELTETFQTSVAQSTAHANEPTYGNILKTITVHPQLGYEYLAPLGQEIVVKGGGMLGFELTAPAAVNVRGYVMFEE